MKTPAKSKPKKRSARVEAESSTGPRPEFVERVRQHREWMRALGVEGPKTPEEMHRLNRIIAGEE